MHSALHVPISPTSLSESGCLASPLARDVKAFGFRLRQHISRFQGQSPNRRRLINAHVFKQHHQVGLPFSSRTFSTRSWSTPVYFFTWIAGSGCRQFISLQRHTNFGSASIARLMWLSLADTTSCTSQSCPKRLTCRVLPPDLATRAKAPSRSMTIWFGFLVVILLARTTSLKKTLSTALSVPGPRHSHSANDPMITSSGIPRAQRYPLWRRLKT